MKIADLIEKIIGKKTSDDMLTAAVEALQAEAEEAEVKLAAERLEAVKKAVAEQIALFATGFCFDTLEISIYLELDCITIKKPNSDANVTRIDVNTSFSTTGEVYDQAFLRERYYAEVKKNLKEFGFEHDSTGWYFVKTFSTKQQP